MRRTALALALLLAAACASSSTAGKPTPRPSAPPAASAAPTAPPTPVPTLAPPRPLSFKLDTVATGLTVPWELAFLPDGSLLVTERPGRVRVVSGGQVQAQPALALNVVAAPGAEGGLLGMALHPGFPNPPDVYLYYTYSGSGGNTNRVSRFAFQEGRLTGERVILDGIPGGQLYHFGGRIAFGPDRMLYITVGEGQHPERAADPRSLGGKVLRVRDDGSAPDDNPFPGSPVFAYGFRNPEGLAWDQTGRLYVSNNGPSGGVSSDFGLCCHDEVDLVQRGGFYGWPVMAGNVPAGRPQDFGNPPARVPPIAESGGVAWAPSGMTFYTPDPHEQATLLLAALKTQELRRLLVDAADPAHVVGQEVVLSGQGRLRDVVSGPDGCAYVLTSNRDGRGSPRAGDDRILKLCPQ